MRSAYRCLSIRKDLRARGADDGAILKGLPRGKACFRCGQLYPSTSGQLLVSAEADSGIVHVSNPLAQLVKQAGGLQWRHAGFNGKVIPVFSHSLSEQKPDGKRVSTDWPSRYIPQQPEYPVVFHKHIMLERTTYNRRRKQVMAQHSTAQQEPCSIPCNLCGSTAVSLLANRSRSGKPLRTVICVRCGLVWSDPLPHNPRRFYEDDYRVSYKGTYSPKPKHILRAGNVAMSHYRRINRFLSEPRVILDVGTGGGEFAYLLQSLGHDVRGIDPNKGYAEYSIREYGLNVLSGFVQDVMLPKE